jgi:hypothetical protein
VYHNKGKNSSAVSHMIVFLSKNIPLEKKRRQEKIIKPVENKNLLFFIENGIL